MGRIDKYNGSVEPYVKDGTIENWIREMPEKEIIKKLGVSHQSFNKYKHDHPELQKALDSGRKGAVIDAKDTLIKKALGFWYTETKTTIRKVNGEEVITVEEYKKYAQPDTGAIHLILKNYCEDWHNDDNITIKLKQMQLELAKEKIEVSTWN